ncbi:Transcriptional regulator RPN4 [Coniochaeta hoffmannii]|uniref:Transcriptional regulator RPN4 n=1 Tax=Coniochaeta hoffmannii TaxID=91930 RepID=A0AA38R713_9PEZI|nr:Transcriptional regulator RPN4 [Coniochaeta hoffmannii]
MLLTEDYCPSVASQQQQHQHHHHHHQQTQNFLHPRSRANIDFDDSARQTSTFANNSDTDLDLEAYPAVHSLSSSPLSTQSLLSQYSGIQGPLSGYDNIPTIAVPREAQQSTLFDLSGDAPLFGNADLMQHPDSWLQSGQLTPRSAARFSSHHRESSLSSLGSAGPASPYSHNTSNPQIAVPDSVGDHFHGLPSAAEEFNHYQLASKSFHGPDNFYANYPNYQNYASADQAFSNGTMSSNGRQRNDRVLLPPRDFPGSHSNTIRSRPVSVASSVTSDSPLTPSGEPDEAERRRKIAFNAIPKLDRTMTDIYSDELFNPNFTITSAPPTQMPVSPSNEVFAQRLQAANSQHLSAVHSPVSAPSRDRSPFQHGSPLAPAPSHDFSSAMPSPHVVFNSAQQLREQRKAAQDAQAVQQQLARSASIGTPQTISPKEALLEYHAPDGEAEQPLFPQPSSTPFESEHMKEVSQAPQSYGNLDLESTPFGNFAPSNMPSSMPISRQYPFTPQRSQHSGSTPTSNSSMAHSRVSPADSTPSDSSHTDMPVERPSATGADGGTYTCTYHGCTLRFETPALLQKHKREGHRQAHGLGGPRRPDSADEGMTSSLLNSQAGPHRCDRINPSTGKPCNTIFSRPYDLTRHEDTIHNARKQKVRCNLCTDDKSFSRADALTRHYRVCHPEVEFPGKHRRRGGN